VELAKAYEPAAVEERWYRIWRERGYFRGDEKRPGKAFSMVIRRRTSPARSTWGTRSTTPSRTSSPAITACSARPRCGSRARPRRHRTQNVVERQLAAEGTDRRALRREQFALRVWSWKKESGSTITRQLARLGVSCDWERERFTMDEGLSRASARCS